MNDDKRMEDAIKKGYTNIPSMANQSKEMLNLANGGMFGRMPAIGSKDNRGEFISNQAYVGMDVIPVLLQAPEFFDVIESPDGEVDLSGILKALVELHPQEISGLQAGIKAEFADVQLPGGEVQEDLVNMTRDRTELTFTWIEKKGRPIQRFLDFWMRYGGMDPDTGSALIGTVKEFELEREDVYTYDRWRMSMLFIEPDITQRYCEDAWVVVSMFPKENGPVEAKSSKNNAKEIRELAIPFTGIALFNDSTRQLGNQCLLELREGVLGEVPDNAPLFLSSKDAELVGQKGYNHGDDTACDIKT